MMNDNYLDVLYQIVETELHDKSPEEINEIKSIIKDLIKAEKEYEFNDERPRIKQLLETLIHS